MSTTTYREVKVTRPGELNLSSNAPFPEPAAGNVRLWVESCGVCHSDAAIVEGQFSGSNLPRVTGHEVVGRIDALGSGVQSWGVVPARGRPA
jgi:D-arabinose 1-dehydrogenase-like Zn-dependent alcohol dehydrogenase